MATHPRNPTAWEPLVYGRTYGVDYGYLAVPGSFDREDQEWARCYVSGSRRSVTHACLNRVVRFFLFKSRAYCGVGVSLPAGMVCDDRTRTSDYGPREIYVTLGGVAPYDQAAFPEPPHHPGIPALEGLRRGLRTIFGPLYEEFVIGRWLEGPPLGNGGALVPTRSEPRVWFPPDEPVVSSAAPFPLDADDDVRVHAWPPASEEELWAAACATDPPVSLCLNLSGAQDALAARFGHVTLREAQARKTLYRKDVPRPADPAAGPDRPAEVFSRTLLWYNLTITDIRRLSQAPQDRGDQPRGRGQGLR